MSLINCVIKKLTPAQEVLAAELSLKLNPENGELARMVERETRGRRGVPGVRRLALVVGYRWPKTGVDLSVQFLATRSTVLRRRILEHMNAWNKTARVRFRETDGTGDVRISRVEGDGHWSWVGTQIRTIPENEATMNLDGFTAQTAESEFLRVVRHETGHTLGFDHEQLRPEVVDRIHVKKAIAYYRRTQGWTPEETRAQVLTPLLAEDIEATPEPDEVSIMCYDIPAEITVDRVAIPGGADISAKDYAFVTRIYPKERRQPEALPLPRAPAVALGVNDVPPPPPPAVAAPGTDTFHIVVMDTFDPERTAAGEPKYARVYASYGGAQVTTAMRLKTTMKGEAPTAFGRIIGVHERIKKYTNHNQGALPSDGEMMDFGRDLFEALFQGDVRRLYDEARSRQHHRKLDLVLTSMISWIAEKPWEFAYDAGRRSFLATEDTFFTRNALSAVPAEVIAPRAGPLRILVVAAQPVGMGLLSIGQEVEVIRRGFRSLEAAGLARVEVLARVTPRSLQERLSTRQFDIVHFIGHGGFDEKKQEGVLYFVDESGRRLPLRERAAREIFCRRGVSLVFLNSCQSGTGGRSDFNKGIAQSLVAHGLPALVANQYSVLDSSATSFAQHFYWALAQGMSLGQAACEARIAVNSSLQGELIDWAVPVVYARDPAITVCVPGRPPRTGPVPPPAPGAGADDEDTRSFQPMLQQVPLLPPPGGPGAGARAAMRAAAAAPPSSPKPAARQRVALWDIDNVFPGLESLAGRMNAAQAVFEFVVVAVSVPMDAWDRENHADDGQPYLWAEKFAGRVAHLAAELQVDVLAGLTRHWLRDDDTLNLYGWWPEEKTPPVLLFSCAGPDLPAAGASTDRAVANALVTGLTGYLADTGTHGRGPKDCPLYYNEERSLAHITGRQAFDKTCRAVLAKSLRHELPALEALLRAF